MFLWAEDEASDPPALAVGEAQVHGVAGEEGAAVQRELHAGWVGDRLAQQRHHSGSRGRRWAKGADVARAVENLREGWEENCRYHPDSRDENK